MQVKENVYKENDATGSVARATVPTQGERAEKDQTVLAKFKDVNALVKAYEALEAEFTRRSQRLKALEKAAENLGGEERKSGASGVEKLRENAVQRRAQERAFDRFVAEIETENAGESDAELCQDKPDEECRAGDGVADGEKVFASAEAENAAVAEQLSAQTMAQAKESEQGLQETGSFKKSEVGSGVAPCVQQNILSPIVEECEKPTLSHEELLERASRDEGVRLKIIGEYLSSLQKSGAPLMQGGGGTLAAPPLKARSVVEAGKMALQALKKERVEN